MKRLLSYIGVSLLMSLWLSSCSSNESSILSADTANVQIRITMPMEENPNSKAVAYKETGTSYENTIYADLAMDNISIFVFDADNGEFLNKVTDLTIQGKSDDIVRNVSGVLSTANFTPATKNLKLVFMANYSSRGFKIPSPLAEVQKTQYDYWKEVLIYKYGNTAWTPGDGNVAKPKYIPMSGETVIPIVPSNDVQTYFANIDLTRIIAKVRVEVVKDCPYQLRSLRVNNIPLTGYYLPFNSFLIPENGNGATEVLTLSAKPEHPKYIQFYIPEQFKDNATIDLFFAHLDGSPVDPDATTADKIYFMNYKTNKKFDIVRNHYYIFKVNKIPDERVDVDVSVMDWVEHDIDVNYE